MSSILFPISSGIEASVSVDALLTFRCAISVSPSGILVSETPIGNLPVPNITSTNWPKAANTFVLVILTNTLDFSDSLNFKDLLNYHNDNLSEFTIASKKYEYQNPFGVIVNKGKKVIKISEKPIYKFNVNAGVYVVNHKLLRLLKKNKYMDMPDFIEKLLKKKKKN